MGQPLDAQHHCPRQPVRQHIHGRGRRNRTGTTLHETITGSFGKGTVSLTASREDGVKFSLANAPTNNDTYPSPRRARWCRGSLSSRRRLRSSATPATTRTTATTCRSRATAPTRRTPALGCRSTNSTRGRIPPTTQSTEARSAGLSRSRGAPFPFGHRERVPDAVVQHRVDLTVSWVRRRVAKSSSRHCLLAPMLALATARMLSGTRGGQPRRVAPLAVPRKRGINAVKTSSFCPSRCAPSGSPPAAARTVVKTVAAKPTAAQVTAQRAARQDGAAGQQEQQAKQGILRPTGTLPCRRYQNFVAVDDPEGRPPEGFRGIPRWSDQARDMRSGVERRLHQHGGHVQLPRRGEGSSDGTRSGYNYIGAANYDTGQISAHLGNRRHMGASPRAGHISIRRRENR